MQKLFVDVVGKFPRSKVGNTAILVCVDAFTKICVVSSSARKTSGAMIRVLKERIFLFSRCRRF